MWRVLCLCCGRVVLFISCFVSVLSVVRFLSIISLSRISFVSLAESIGVGIGIDVGL